MGRLGRLISALKTTFQSVKTTEAKVNPGAGPAITCDQFQNAGDDAQPLPQDYCVLVPIDGTGRWALVGYLDPEALQRAGPGERRLYARDASGEEVVSHWLKSTGEAALTNANGGLRLLPDGSFNINGVTITPDGRVIDASGVELGTHNHNITSGSSAPGPTAGPNPG